MELKMYDRVKIKSLAGVQGIVAGVFGDKVVVEFVNARQCGTLRSSFQIDPSYKSYHRNDWHFYRAEVIDCVVMTPRAEEMCKWELPDGIYHATNGGVNYIVRFENGESKENIYMGGRGCGIPSYGSRSGFWSDWGKYTPASPEEEAWLRASIEAGELTQKPIVLPAPKQLYPIFN